MFVQSLNSARTGGAMVRVRCTRLILYNFMLIDAPYTRVTYTDGNMLFSLLERSCYCCKGSLHFQPSNKTNIDLERKHEISC